MRSIRWCVRSGSIVLVAACAAAMPGMHVAQAAAPAGSPAIPAREQPPIVVPRLSAPIRLSGDLADPGWKQAAVVDEFYEIEPGDNVPPGVATTAYLAYDDRYLYVAFRCDDPDPSRIRAPYVDRDAVLTDQDMVAVYLDTRGDGKTALQLRANPRGIQADAVNSEATLTEDFAPDFFFDTAAKIGTAGWTVEMRIPFSTLRYPRADPQKWGVLLFRNFPRKDRHRIFASPQPRGSSCFLCHQRRLEGLTGLPSGVHYVLAPYGSVREQALPRAAAGGGSGAVRPLEAGALRGDAGLDAKLLPGPDTAVDATVNPDFSQVESDVAQIGVNQRFALFYPEKRPFFLERVDLLQTTIPAVYTRTITSPRWGARVTGESGSTSYTALVAEDRGGGSLVLPGPELSRLVPQDSSSFAGFARVKQAVGGNFAGFLATDREGEGGGGGYNRVLGPDFQWRPGGDDVVTGQLLWSATRDSPAAPGIAAADALGRVARTGNAADATWTHSTRTFDFYVEYQDFSDRFRADDGYVPQTGFRRGDGYAGWSFYPAGLFWHVRPTILADYSTDRDGALLLSRISPGVGFDGRWRSIGEVNFRSDRVRTGGVTLSRDYVTFLLGASPSRFVPSFLVSGEIGDEIDFDGHRPGRGGELKASVTVRPTDHLDLQLNADRSWLSLRTESGARGRLFTADVARLKATYSFGARCFVRLIGQWIETTTDPALSASPASPRSGGLQASALFAYRLNWQTVLFAGYGDERERSERGTLEPDARRFFLKVSWAFQR